MNSCEHVAGLPTTQSWQKSGFSHSESFGEEGGEEGQKARIPACPAALCRRPGRSGSLDRAPSQAVLPTGAPHAVLPRAGRHSPSRSHLLPPLRPRHGTAGSRDCPPSSETENTVLRFDKQRDSQLRQKHHRGAGPGRSTAAGRKRGLVHVIFPRRDVFFPLSVQKASAQPSADLTPQENSASIPSQAAVVENF